MKRICVLLLGLSIAACTSEQQPALTEARAKLNFVPDTFQDCTPMKAGTAMIQWDATESGATAVDIVIIGSDGTVGKFATGRAVGEKESGPWMTPGIVIALRDSASGAELARTVGASKPCND